MRAPACRWSPLVVPMGIRLSAAHLAAAVPLLVAAAAFGLYLRTAARTITWAHPTGYPLYLLLGHLFTYLPAGEVAFRVGLLSAVSGALGAGLVAFLVSELRSQNSEVRTQKSEPGTQHSALSTQHSVLSPVAVGALAAGLGLATSPMYWSQAVIAEVYALHAALVLGGLVLLALWRPGRDRLAVGLAFLFGVGMGNHVTLAFLAGLGGLYVVLRDPGALRRRALPLALAAFALGLLLYLYVPLRAAADPPVNWGAIADGPGFVAHVTGQSYRGYLGGRPLGDTLARAPVLARLMGEQFTWPGLVLALVGLGELLRRRPGLARLLVAYLLVTVIFTLLYNAKDGEVYLLPVALVLAVGLGVEVARLANSALGPGPAVALVAALVVWQIVAHGPAMDLSADRAAADYARTTLVEQAPNAMVQTETDEHLFALWYAQIVEGLRPDVAVVDRRGLGHGWYRDQMERRYPGVFNPAGAGR